LKKIQSEILPLEPFLSQNVGKVYTLESIREYTAFDYGFTLTQNPAGYLHNILFMNNVYSTFFGARNAILDIPEARRRKIHQSMSTIDGSRSMRKVLLAVTSVFIAFGIGRAEAGTIMTFGSGSSVNRIDRAATFDSISVPFIDLNGYTEDGILVSVPDYSHVNFDAFGTGFASTGFYYGSGGNQSFVTIGTTDSIEIFSLEFRLGNGNLFNQGPSATVWETWKDGVLVSSGNTFVTKGSVVGWQDVLGFDELRVASGSGVTQFGQTQGIALDDLNLQLVQSASVPEGGSIIVGFCLGLFSLFAVSGLIGIRRSW
jgi:hypothetical protein